ncbi:DUF3566 domain-containing protein [Streptomyces sp. HNM0574]|uniref:DUF3566 domain-containing protein n=1 Tax=Streptomyces sp. HNM0574 TaxID=2714954 RepID=UPI00146B4B3E|nr:hypothetical protein [Streptomyces sp. HNM0574]
MSGAQPQPSAGSSQGAAARTKSKDRTKTTEPKKPSGTPATSEKPGTKTEPKKSAPKSGSGTSSSAPAAGAQPLPAAEPQSAGASAGGAGTAAQPQAEPHRPPQAYPAPSAAEDESLIGGVRKPRTDARTVPRTRKARLRVAKADPWSVMKVSFLLSLALGLCTIVAASVLWMVMDAMGVFTSVGGTVSEATGTGESGGFDLESFLSLPRVLLFTSVIAVIDVVLATALATLGAFIYNISAGFVGGVELTLAEDE